jgi:hypothetical protein
VPDSFATVRKPPAHFEVQRAHKEIRPRDSEATAGRRRKGRGNIAQTPARLLYFNAPDLKDRKKASGL